MSPTGTQLRVLKALFENPGSYIEYRFDLGGMLLRTASGDSHIVPGLRSVDACRNRGWITYTIHKWGNAETHIERRYVLTYGGKQIVQESK